MNTPYNVGDRIMNTYIYQTAAGYIMVDTGYEHSFASVKKKLENAGITLADISYVFLTHAHDDHAGFLNELLHENQNLRVIMSDKAMPTLKRGQNSFEGGCSTFFAWIFCKLMALFGKAEHRFPRIEDQFDNRLIEITDSNKNELEEILQGKILNTPGHTCDSISLKRDNMIFCGDAAMNGFPSEKRFIIWIENKEQYEKSWEVLLNEDVEMLYPAHGKPFLTSELSKYKDKISSIRLRPLI